VVVAAAVAATAKAVVEKMAATKVAVGIVNTMHNQMLQEK
jgi:hypothetical protein